MSSSQRPPAFGTVLADSMITASFREGQWSAPRLQPCEPIPMHPAAHVLHYASTCFDACKAYRWADGSVNLFRVDRHIARLRQSAGALLLPEPDPLQLEQMMHTLVDAVRKQIPPAPGALYLRPVLFGTTPNIAAATVPTEEATLIVLASPVVNYYAGRLDGLRVFVDDVHARTPPHLGVVKAGGNYAAALGPTVAARRKYGADQALFCPGGQVQETGAANFLLLRAGHVLTRSLDSSFLHGITRDSILTLARADGYRVEERTFDVAEMLEWVREGEAALSGSAILLAAVGELIHRDGVYRVGGGGQVTSALRKRLVDIQLGVSEAPAGWMTRV